MQAKSYIDYTGRNVIHYGGANHFKGFEAVGGKLYLYQDQLEFKSHEFNIQVHSLFIPLKEIKEVGFYNTLGLIPNGLKITWGDGKIEKFVVQKRKLWREEINKAIAQ